MLFEAGLPRFKLYVYCPPDPPPDLKAQGTFPLSNSEAEMPAALASPVLGIETPVTAGLKCSDDSSAIHSLCVLVHADSGEVVHGTAS